MKKMKNEFINKTTSITITKIAQYDETSKIKIVTPGRIIGHLDFINAVPVILILHAGIESPSPLERTPKIPAVYDDADTCRMA